MIAQLRGRVVAVESHAVVLDVGGVGFRVYVPGSLIKRELIGSSITLYTHLHVRENELRLYGCDSEEALQLFTMLLDVNGVGPRGAMALLSLWPPRVIKEAIAQGRVDQLAQAPGIGPKTAQRIVFHLRERVGEVVGEAQGTLGWQPGDEEVLAALTALGYSVVEAQAALQSVPPDVSSTEERIRLALRYFAGR